MGAEFSKWGKQRGVNVSSGTSGVSVSQNVVANAYKNVEWGPQVRGAMCRGIVPAVILAMFDKAIHDSKA
eukprot:NODE_6479_length_324_cov_516.476364_g5326_i0.p2 GENE.NODE_6479_length_324_cov_516.476364_g5326_i0~~NODE_6479_length_324_cov_516.476364_g5326_i0.p2  ORF type:complete len:70 (-),score=19.84 NODE_6479_length_324_cov_516.476364_g5326_i0:82-291(-)